MNSDMLAYLERDDIGKVVAKGLANVYTHKPETPVKYLAHWLKTYSSNQKELQRLTKVEHQKAQNLKIYAKSVQIEQTMKVEHQKKEDEHKSNLDKFKQMIKHHQYQQQLLLEVFPEFVEHLTGLTGAYIGELNHPPKEVTEEDADENDTAHLNLSAPKLINYIGSSKSHAAMMRGNSLSLDKGVTAAAFSLSLEDPVPQVGQDGVQIPPEKKDKYVYIPNVVKNQNVHYFRLPKLGSYIAVPLIYNSYLKESIFDAALEARIKYLSGEEEFRKARQDEIKEVHTEREQIEKKIHELTEKNGDEATLEQLKADLAESHKKEQEILASKFEGQVAQLPTEKREFVLCGDNIGQDKQISQANRNLIVQFVTHFGTSWQNKEKQLLTKDVEYQIEITKHLQRTAEAEIQHLEKCQQIDQQNKAIFDQIEDQNLRNYKTWEFELHALQKAIKQHHQYEESFIKLKHFRVIKFKELIQLLLHFLKHSKSEINLPGKTILNWKKIRQTSITADTFHKIMNYVIEGPKEQHYPRYCKATTIIEKLEQFNELDVFHYNYGLGVLLKYLKKALKHRISNVELRKIQKQNERKVRQQLLQQNQKLTEQKRLALQKFKAALPPQEVESFNEEEWSAKHDEEFPLKEIPPEVIDDIDNDI